MSQLEKEVKRLGQQIKRLKRRSDQIAWWRLIAFVIGLGLIAIAFDQGKFVGIGASVLIGGLFIWLVNLSRSIQQMKRIYEIARSRKQAQIARADLVWDSIPQPTTPSIPLHHPFATDLNLHGPQSVHHLIDQSTSREGSQRLFDWLSNQNPDSELIIQRQRLIKELTTLTIWRQQLAIRARLAFNRPHARWQPENLTAWLNAPSPIENLEKRTYGMTGWAILNWLLLAATLIWQFPPYVILTFFAYWGLLWWSMISTGDTLSHATAMEKGLLKLYQVFELLEKPRYTQPKLQTFLAPFQPQGQKPSTYLRRLSRLTFAASFQRSPIIWLLTNSFLPWDLYLARWVDRERRAIAQDLPIWLDRWFDLEALCSLADFAWLNPDYTFPTFHLAGDASKTPNGNQSGHPVLSVDQLGHPLIPRDKRVCNNAQVNHIGQIHLLTGSNMAGKSSFLRAMGVNLAIAYAGGVVVADRFDSCLMRLFTCINVSDSVTDGISYFYAEVRRLKQLAEALTAEDTRPLCFFIDEIFRGTNNRERLIGSRAYIRSLVDQNGIGLVSTHDLELIHLADEWPNILNFHFRDSIKDGEMVFDYRLRPGPCPTTNALRIMALAGLPTESI